MYDQTSILEPDTPGPGISLAGFADRTNPKVWLCRAQYFWERCSMNRDPNRLRSGNG